MNYRSQNRAGALRRQRGLSLVEVMVAMAIGLILLGGVGYMFVGSSRMNTLQTDGVRMQETVRNAIDMMGRAVRQAGYRLDVSQEFDDEFALEGTNGASGASDILIVRHDPTWANNPALPLQGVERNCEGNNVTSDNVPNATTGATAANTQFVTYQFRVVAGKLMCYTDTSASPANGVVVADNVENLQVRYGLGNGNESVLNYVDAPAGPQWRQVSAVRLYLLVRGPSAGLVTGSQTVLFNGVSVTTTDSHVRRVVEATFSVRNQARWK